MNAGSCRESRQATATLAAPSDAQSMDQHCSRPSTMRNLDAAGWLVPAAILALIPKCPLCVAMYLAVGFGVGVSLSTATYLRFGFIALCVASLAYFAVRHAVSLRRRKDA
jgi:hypothetical protein